MLSRVHDSTSNDSVSMMVLPKPAIFMAANIMTKSQHVNVHNYYTKQDNSQYNTTAYRGSAKFVEM